MIQKALEQRWPVKPEYREALVKRAVRTIADPNSSPREVAAASRILLAAEAQNIDDERHADNAMESDRNRILSIVARLDTERSNRIVDASGVRLAQDGDTVDDSANNKNRST